MEKLAAVSFDTTKIENPENQKAGGWFVWLTRNNTTVAQETIPATSSSASFSINDVGTYVAHVVRMTVTGSSVGGSVSSEPVIVTPEMIAVPLTVTLAIGDVPNNVFVKG